MFSLDSLLHEAECLERGSNVGSLSAISLNQLSKFFHQVSNDQEPTLEGRILLAQQGIDSTRTETLIKDMQLEQKPDESSSYKTSQKNRYQKMAPYTAIQVFERFKQDNNEHQRQKLRQEMLSFFKKQEISSHPIDPEFKLFPTDPQKLGDLSKYAQIFADFQTNPKYQEDQTDFQPLESTQIIAEQSIKAIEKFCDPNDPNTQVKIDFFVALANILKTPNDEGLPSDLSKAETSPELLRLMVSGSLNFLIEQYRYLNYSGKSELTVNDIEDFVLKHYPDVQPPWPYIWECIRSGSYDLVEYFCQGYLKETAEFWHYYKLFIIQKEEPSEEVHSNVYINTKPKNQYEALRTFCYIYVIGEDVQQLPVSYLDTAEDFIFLLISPHRYSNSSFIQNIDGSYTILNDLQQLVSFEARKIFSHSKDRFIFSMLMLIILKFDLCAESLIKNRLFPVEVLHILIILKNTGVWKDSSTLCILPRIIDEFISLLPLSMVPQIVTYLSIVDDRFYLVKFLLSLDVSKFQVNLQDPTNPMKAKALKMVEDEISSKLYSVNSIKLAAVALGHAYARDIINSISDGIKTNFTLSEISETILICSVLLVSLSDVTDPSYISLQNTSIEISIYALSMSDQLTQSQKEALLANVGKLISFFASIDNRISTDGQVDNSDRISIVSRLSNLLHLLVLFDSGRSDLVMTEIRMCQEIIPFEEKDLEPAIDWVNEKLSSASLVGAVVLRFLSYFLENVTQNFKTLQVLFAFCDRIQILSDDLNEKILPLKDRFSQSIIM